MSNTMIQRRKCQCDCGHKHVVETIVEIETIPVGVEVSIVPNESDSGWSVTISDYINDNVFDMPASNMAGARWIVDNVARKLIRPGYRFVVATPSSRFETHSRINTIEFNVWADESLSDKKKKDDWYATLVAKSTRQAVRGANRTFRLGYKK